MSFNRQRLGKFGETLATDFLENQGYTILGVNLRLHTGEIDLLAGDGETIVIVEVKLKTNPKYGHPAEMVHFYKQKKLLLLARELMLKYPGRQVRIDVVAVDLSCKPPLIEHFENAVITR